MLKRPFKGVGLRDAHDSTGDVRLLRLTSSFMSSSTLSPSDADVNLSASSSSISDGGLSGTNKSSSSSSSSSSSPSSSCDCYDKVHSHPRENHAFFPGPLRRSTKQQQRKFRFHLARCNSYANQPTHNPTTGNSRTKRGKTRCQKGKAGK